MTRLRDTLPIENLYLTRIRFIYNRISFIKIKKQKKKKSNERLANRVLPWKFYLLAEMLSGGKFDEKDSFETIDHFLFLFIFIQLSCERFFHTFFSFIIFKLF